MRSPLAAILSADPASVKFTKLTVASCLYESLPRCVPVPVAVAPKREIQVISGNKLEKVTFEGKKEEAPAQ